MRDYRAKPVAGRRPGRLNRVMRETPADGQEASTGETAAPAVLVLVRDLIFASRIGATAKHVGIPIRLLRDPRQLADAPPAARLIVDLNLDGSIEATAAWKRTTGGAVVGFVSHIDTATIARARDAGVDRVIARSKFVEELATLLRAADPRAS